jgi:hypothetical protein
MNSFLRLDFNFRQKSRGMSGVSSCVIEGNLRIIVIYLLIIHYEGSI